MYDQELKHCIIELKKALEIDIGVLAKFGNEQAVSVFPVFRMGIIEDDIAFPLKALTALVGCFTLTGDVKLH